MLARLEMWSVVDPVLNMKTVQLPPSRGEKGMRWRVQKKGRGEQEGRRVGREGGRREEPLSDKFSPSGFRLNTNLMGVQVTPPGCLKCLPPSSPSTAMWVLTRLFGKRIEVDNEPLEFWMGGHTLSYILRRCDSVTSLCSELPEISPRIARDLTKDAFVRLTSL